ncbi:MAG: mechanosensitive ion channel family protein [Desulfurococcales archaeon]|nr:mechanosensitive ion channel family protein [Desulfurococcales archaeon]
MGLLGGASIVELISGSEALSEFRQYSILILIIIASLIIAHFIKKFLSKILYTILPRQISETIIKIVYYSVIFLGFMIAIGTLGIDLTTLVIAGGFAGIIVGLALQPLLSNLFAGIYLLGEKSIVPGDHVLIDDIEGIVLEMSVMSTKIKTLDGVLLRIPNNKVFESKLYNYSRFPVRRLEFSVSIAYKEDADKAISIIKDIVDRHHFVMLDPEPEIFVSSLGSSGVEIIARVWVPSSEWYTVVRELTWNIKKALSDSGVEIPFMQVDVWLRTPIEIKKYK